ncbi:MAG: 2-amino-4-hydroxy-6-hydroxymethyldihydropteridine diphosphokinase [Sciscionella sp.]
MSRATLSIGSNIGDRLEHLRGALRRLAGTGAVTAVSSVYETEPWGVTDQDPFLNAIVLVADRDTDADGWLARAHQLEAHANRVRTRRWGPRSLDVDVITVDELTSDDKRLTLPHPRAHERAFVLVPLAEVAPEQLLPLRGTAAELLRALPTTERDGVRRLVGVSLLPVPDGNRE